jgi:hypothetical protein
LRNPGNSSPGIAGAFVFAAANYRSRGSRSWVQTEKNSARAYVLRFAPDIGHCSMQLALRIWDKTRPMFPATRLHQPNGRNVCAARRRLAFTSVECSPGDWCDGAHAIACPRPRARLWVEGPCSGGNMRRGLGKPFAVTQESARQARTGCQPHWRRGRTKSRRKSETTTGAVPRACKTLRPSKTRMSG